MNHGFKQEPAKSYINKQAFGNDILVPKNCTINFFFVVKPIALWLNPFYKHLLDMVRLILCLYKYAKFMAGILVCLF